MHLPTVHSHRLAALLSTAIALLAFSGCTSLIAPRPDPARYYVLTPGEPSDKTLPAAASPSLSLAVETFRIPAYLDRSELVWNIAENRLGISDTDLWLEPLAKSGARIFAHNLARHLGTKSLTYPPAIANNANALRISVDIAQFEIHPGSEVRLQANWTLSGNTHANEENGSSSIRIPLPVNSGLDACVRAMSRALDQLAVQIAGHLQQRKKGA
jgi:uncharacterized lipoprotein YmbA